MNAKYHDICLWAFCATVNSQNIITIIGWGRNIKEAFIIAKQNFVSPPNVKINVNDLTFQPVPMIPYPASAQVWDQIKSRVLNKSPILML